MSIANARSLLFVPATRPDRVEKALLSGADVVIVDLEDSVPDSGKDEARQNVARLLAGGADIAVRINAAGTPWHRDDAALARAHDVAVVLPKADADSVAAVDLNRIVALIESAQGLLHAAAIAQEPAVERLAFGHLDLAAEIGVSPDEQTVMDSARVQLLVASFAAGLEGPIDGVTGQVRDPERLAHDLAHAVRLGFTGKLCIHPAQVEPVHTALLPSPEEIAHAERVLAAPKTGVTVVDGQMVDAPVIARAERILARANRSPQPGKTKENPNDRIT